MRSRFVTFQDDFRESDAKRYFIEFGKPFTIEETRHSFKIYNDQISWLLADGRMWGKYLGLMNMVKKEVKERFDETQYPFKDQRDLFAYNPMHFPDMQGILENVREIDLSAAYVTTANMLGLISNELYEKLKKCPKQFRLKILGILGMTKIKRSFDKDGKQLGDTEKIFDDILKAAWSLIVNYTNDSMRVTVKELDDRFIFYWFDNMFFVGKFDGKELLKRGYSFKKNETAIAYQKTPQILSTILRDKRLFSFKLGSVITFSR